MVRDSSDGRARNCYWPMPFRKSCRITVTNEGRRRVTNLYYHVDWAEGAVASREHAVLPRPLPAVAARARRRLALRVPERQGQGPLRRHGAVGRAGRGRLVRRGRRLLLGRRREEAVDRGHRQRGLLQRRLGPARERRPVLRRDRRRGDGSRLAHDRLSLAPARPDPVHEVAQGRDRAQGLDVQRRRRGQVGLRRAHRPDVERRVLVPGGHRARTSRPCPTARRGCRRATPCRSRSRSRWPRSRRRGARPRSFPELFWSKDVILFEARGQGLEDRDPLRRARGRRLRALHGGRPGLGLRHLHGAARRQAARRAASSSTSRAPTCGRRRSSTATRWRPTSAPTTRSAGRA